MNEYETFSLSVIFYVIVSSEIKRKVSDFIHNVGLLICKQEMICAFILVTD